MGTDEQSSHKLRILVIDDEPAARFAISDFLESHGFEVETASDGQTGQQVFRNHRPDAVILDYLLPDATALEILPGLKATDANVPILILTAHGSIDLAVRAIKAGADQFMTKPMDLPSMLMLLDREICNYHRRLSPGGAA